MEIQKKCRCRALVISSITTCMDTTGKLEIAISIVSDYSIFIMNNGTSVNFSDSAIPSIKHGFRCI